MLDGRPRPATLMSGPLDPNPTKTQPKRRWLRRTLIASQVVLGLGLGLALAEYMFWKRDEGAFPHVNFYVEDPELGVRLEPNAAMRFRLRDNPLTTIHVNTQGYRGADWPAPTPDAAPGTGEILVLGDSQVFGLGVEDDETFSAKLAEATGRRVLNAGVPTYGPPEYMRLAKQLLEQRKPQTVVVVLNFLNDPFELDRPNVDRHAVWDGWAVRRETAPEQVRQFPGRKWLYSKSHAFYALRRWQHERQGRAESDSGEVLEGAPAGPQALDLGTPSEGSWQELVVKAEAARRDYGTATKQAAETIAKQREQLEKVEQDLELERDSLDELIVKTHWNEFDEFQADIAKGRPGDIVEEQYAEEGRSVELTAALIRETARARQKLLDEMIEQEKKKKKRPTTQVQDLVAAQAELSAERAALRQAIAKGAAPVERPASLFEPWLSELSDLCEQHGAELVVVALPFDVQIDPAEWDKYGVDEQPDMSGSLILLDDLVASAEHLRLRALNATEALRSAQPGAFLDHDIHMTPNGHAALAEALVETLARPRPLQMPAHGLPEGTTFVPANEEWDPQREVLVSGSTKAGCSSQVSGDWFKLVCKTRWPKNALAGIEVREGATPMTMIMHSKDGISLVTPLQAGQPITARIWWAKKARDLEIRWPLGEDQKPRFSAALVDVPDEPGRTLEPSPEAGKLCECHQKAFQQSICANQGKIGEDYSYYDEEWYRHHDSECVPSCGELWGDIDLTRACEQAYPGDCEALLSCVQHDPLFAPACPQGSVHAFTSNACFIVCDEAHPCTQGTCTPWQGSGVCQ